MDQAVTNQTGRRLTRAVSSPAPKGQRNDVWWAVAFLLPMATGMVIFYFGPIFATLYYSFTHVGVFGGSKWVGFANYVDVLTSPRIHRALLNTLFYTAIILC